jgi:hypothetical protein
VGRGDEEEEKRRMSKVKKDKCRLEVHGHNGEIKRNGMCEEIDEREVRFV